MTNIYVLPDQPSFPLGDLYVTASVDRELDQTDIWKALERHGQRDWGDVCAEDWQDNDISLTNGTRLLSVYHDRKGVKFWVITEADRSDHRASARRLLNLTKLPCHLNLKTSN